jgi:SAM-dependent methyltransferase
VIPGGSIDDRAVFARPRVWQDEELREVQRRFDAHFERNGPLRRVLDAGAGGEMPLDIPLSAHLVAVDISEEALARNVNADEKFVADLQTHEFPAGSFDAAICWWVLEHVPNPMAVIGHLALSLRPGGLMLVGVPYLWGFKALVTKATPYRFHVWLARRSNPSAGVDGHGPFPTTLKVDIAPSSLRRIAHEHSLSLIYEKAHSMEPELRLPRPLRLVWRLTGRTLKVITLGRYDPLLSEYVALFEKH